MALTQSFTCYSQEDTTKDAEIISDHEKEMNLILRAHRTVPPMKLICNCQRRYQSSQLVPDGAIDTHVHVFDPDLGAYAPERAYTPPSARLTELLSFNTSLASSKRPAQFVLVQPSPYGTDNTVLLSILDKFHSAKQYARGIAVVDISKITDEELWHMHLLGIRGLRLNMQANGAKVDVSRLKLQIHAAAARIQHLPGWKLQLFVPAYVWSDLYATVLSLPVTIIADHTGGVLAASKLAAEFAHSPTLQPGFAALVALARAGKIVIKISGLYRSSTAVQTAYADVEPIIRELAQEVPDALIWGSDWPHTGEGKDRGEMLGLGKIEPFRQIDNHSILRNLREWVNNEQTWMKLMVNNAERLFV